jgi:hypothetical protein
VSPLLADWLDSNSKKEQVIVPTADALRALLDAGRNRYDHPRGKVIDALGYSSDLTTGGPRNQRLEIHVLCGATAAGILNQCFINYAPEGPLSFSAVSKEVKRVVLKALVRVWKPQWGATCGTALRQQVRMQSNLDVGRWCGSTTFVCRASESVETSAFAKYEVENVDSLGYLVHVDPSHEQADPADLAVRVGNVCATLQGMGLGYQSKVG